MGSYTAAAAFHKVHGPVSVHVYALQLHKYRIVGLLSVFMHLLHVNAQVGNASASCSGTSRPASRVGL